jgi:hypothetical protein
MAYTPYDSTGLIRLRQNKALEDATLKKIDNLSDLNDKTASRTNLDVYSKQEVSDLIATQSGNFSTVADITARDALTPADGDRVYVTDNGDGKWAIYLYANTSWNMQSDEDQYLGAITKVNVPVVESLSIASDTVTATDTPYNGVLISEPVITFVDGTKELVDATVSGDTITVTPPNSGDWDGASLKIRYIKQVDAGINPN